METTLQQIGMKCNTDKAHYHRYCDFYENHLPGREFAGRLLEIGIMDGASLHMWREWYPKAEIVGVDINVRPKPIQGITMLEIDATDSLAMSALGMFDIIIDDGSHMTMDQQVSFNHLYKHQLNDGGIYVMEDCHTSFMPSYINTPITTYDLIKRMHNAIEYNGNDGQSITFVIKK